MGAGPGCITQIHLEFGSSNKNLSGTVVFGIASSSNFTAPPTHSSPFHSQTEKQDRNYLLDLILSVWEAVILRGDSSEYSPVLFTTPAPSWAMGFTCSLHSHPWKSISDVSEGERSPTKCGGGEIYPTQIPPAWLAVRDSGCKTSIFSCLPGIF